MKSIFLPCLVILGLILTAAGCVAQDAATSATPEDMAGANLPSTISATGVVVPAQWSVLSIQGQGTVKEILVREGDKVSAGQILIRLNGDAAAQAKISAAAYELAAARQALNTLETHAAEETAIAEQNMALARQVLIDAERDLVQYELKTYEDDLDQARKDAADTKNKLKTAQDDFEPYADYDADNQTRKNYQTKLEDAQRAYEEAIRVENELIQKKELAGAALRLAQARLTLAEDKYNQVKDGPDVQTLGLTQTRLDNAQAQLNAAQEALNSLVLLAPFDGVICSLSIHPGEWLSPGMPALTLGALENLQVETTDLNEIDAANTLAGARVLITFDALPDVEVRGKVERVAKKSSPGSGVNYTAVISLTEIPENLRWGMTAFLDIEVTK